MNARPIPVCFSTSTLTRCRHATLQETMMISLLHYFFQNEQFHKCKSTSVCFDSIAIDERPGPNFRAWLRARIWVSWPLKVWDLRSLAQRQENTLHPSFQCLILVETCDKYKIVASSIMCSSIGRTIRQSFRLFPCLRTGGGNYGKWSLT